MIMRCSSPPNYFMVSDSEFYWMICRDAKFINRLYFQNGPNEEENISFTIFAFPCICNQIRLNSEGEEQKNQTSTADWDFSAVESETIFAFSIFCASFSSINLQAYFSWDVIVLQDYNASLVIFSWLLMVSASAPSSVPLLVMWRNSPFLLLLIPYA